MRDGSSVARAERSFDKSALFPHGSFLPGIVSRRGRLVADKTKHTAKKAPCGRQEFLRSFHDPSPPDISTPKGGGVREITTQPWCGIRVSLRDPPAVVRGKQLSRRAQPPAARGTPSSGFFVLRYRYMDRMTKQLLFWGILGIIFITLVLYAVAKLNERPGPLNGFASCLGEKGAGFYGAFWCPNCGQQKQMFGRSARVLPYVECSTADGKGQLPLCANAGVTAYPTWEFPGSERLTGIQSLQTLAEKTACELPR